jgi:septum site-determining protein MinC
LIDQPVRSGQRIYAPNCDLIVTNHVSAGAELIADGNIHVMA